MTKKTKELLLNRQSKNIL